MAKSDLDFHLVMLTSPTASPYGHAQRENELTHTDDILLNK